jgi:hypothetical protein
MNASLPYGAVFPPETWLPMQLQFTNRSGDEVRGWGVWPVESDRASAEFEIPVTVPAHSRVKVWGYGYVPAQPMGAKEWGELKSGTPLTTLQWRDMSGARLARVPVLGMASWSAGKEATGDTTHPGWVFLAINCAPTNPIPGPSLITSGPAVRSTEAQGDATSLQDLCTQLSSSLNEPILSASVASEWAPRNDAGYAACRFVMLGEGNPDKLDALQRRTLIRFVRSGGNLVVASPSAADQIDQSWLVPLLPVRLIGERQADRIEPLQGGTTAAPLKLLGYLQMAEAVAVDPSPEEHIVLRDAHYVHAAWRALGKGRVIFTSFPIAGLEAKDPRSGDIWRQLLNTARPATDWQPTRLHAEQVSLVAAQLGKPTASWTAAAILAGGFVLLVFLAQLAFVGARRPTAFAIAVGVAVLLSVALVGWTFVRTGRQSLMGSRLSVMDIGPDGGGHQRDITAYVGKNIDDFPITAKDGVLIRPIISSHASIPVIKEKPFSVPQAQVQALRVERVWQADGSAPDDLKVSATARFGESGLQLSIDNQSSQSLLSPVWLWDRAVFSLDDLPAGKSQVAPTRRNAPGDYTNAAVIRSQLAQWRGQVVAAFHTPLTAAMGRRRPIAPQIDAWLSDPPSLTDSAAQMRPQAMARLPVRIEPSAAGSIVKVDPAYVQLVTNGMGVAQYDPITGHWLATNLDAQLLIGFAAPPQIGHIEPTQINLAFDINAPQQTLTIRRGQTSGGKPLHDPNPNGTVVGEWTHPTEQHQVSFTPDASDYDAQGRVWLLVQIHSPSSAGAGGNVVSQWQFRYLEVGIVGKVK